MPSSPVSDSYNKAPMSDGKAELDSTTKTKEDSKVGSTPVTPSGTDDEAYDSSKEENALNEIKKPNSVACKQQVLGSRIPTKTPVIPYKDRANAIIENLTDSDKKVTRLYEENAVIGGPFPVKLQIILKVTEILGQQHIISWLPHGRSFMIHRPCEFEEKIMGEFFKQTKLSSFKRQLNLYDFRRVTRGTDCGSYYHEMFLRGKVLLAKRMVRRKIKGTKSVPSNHSTAMTASNTGDVDDHVPDFYSMPFVGIKNRSGLDLQQANRLMSQPASIPGMNIPNQGLIPGSNFGGAGTLMGDHHLNVSSRYASRFHGAAAASGEAYHLGANSHLNRGLGSCFAAPSSSAYDSLLNRSASEPASSMNLGMGIGRLSPHKQTAPLQHRNPHDFPLRSSLQQLQYNNDLINPAPVPTMQSTSLYHPQQIQSSYVTAMESLNNSYAMAANALKWDLDTASSNMRATPEELVAARHFNRQVGGALPPAYNI